MTVIQSLKDDWMAFAALKVGLGFSYFGYLLGQKAHKFVEEAGYASKITEIVVPASFTVGGFIAGACAVSYAAMGVESFIKKRKMRREEGDSGLEVKVKKK